MAKIRRASSLLAALATAHAVAPPWRTSLKNCWTDATCKRALIVSHGGADNYLNRPYDGFTSFEKAFKDGTDAVKGDFRVTKDNVGMVMHSSPVRYWESLNCVGKRVEEMTEAEARKCKILPTPESFMSVPQLLSWARAKVIVMLCVKEPRDIARAISTLIEQNATDRAFLEVRTDDLRQQVLEAKPPGWDKVYYLAEMGNASHIDAMLLPEFAPLLARLFTFEFDPSWPQWGLNITEVVATKLHSHGVRSLAATARFLPLQKDQEALFRDGFDIVYTYGTAAGVRARKAVDKARGINPAELLLV